ncbi:SDR family NAD(P)-dependent oxidoreductase [Salinispora arenicola]|uniref:SDR family NAD(P)-dependent oxidoreductase n=1 Tax=Salinispora arenicola TaxID=168697 RepID=UPI0003646048|nr:SDR family oxidoreductase [Salinispora arenicola]MCN0154034.1 SDR family oxidoreductase [Salinispora arenicola]
MTTSSRDFVGRTALITGASAGIGAVFARELARRGADLVLVARRADRLTALAAELGATGVTVHVRPADLTQPDAGRDLIRALESDAIDIDVLVNNAGVGLPHAPFAEADPRRLRQMLDLNIGATTDLAHAVLPGMLDRGRGIIINVSSAAAFQPVAYLAAYSATKAYLLTLTEALWAETRATGVRVVAVCPGMTATEFFDHTGPQVTAGQVQTPEQVVAETLHALRRDTPTVVTGRRNALVAQLPRLLPRGLVARITERASRTPVAAPERT